MLAHLVPVEHRTDCKRDLSRAAQRIALAGNRGLVDIAEIEHFAQAGGRRGGREGACGGELGDGIENTPDDEGDDEVAAAVARWAEDAVAIMSSWSATAA
jgi:hypothetical protein